MKTNGTQLDIGGAGERNGSAGRDDAEWSALRYVLGEMNADEAEAFERMLPTDPQACEDVASAARLATDLYTVLAVDGPSRPATALNLAPARSVRTGLWAVVGVVAAVCLLAAGGLSLLPIISDHQEQATSEHSDAGAGSLVAIWTERSAETAADAPTSGLTDLDRVNADDGPSFADADDTDSVLIADDDYDVPGWMIAAIEGGKSWSPDNSATDIREN